MSELGLDPAENFATLKSNPEKYNRVISYVKGEAYKTPAYQSVLGGETSPEFVSANLGDYAQTPEARSVVRAPELEKKFDVGGTKQRYQNFEANAPVAGQNISKQVIEKGGYDVGAKQEEFDKLRTEYANSYRDFVSGKIDSGAYADIVSRLGVANRNLESTTKGYEREVKRGLGEYESNMTRAKQSMENAYANFNKALQDEQAGYKEARGEKVKNLEEMFKGVSDMLDTAKKQEEDYNKSFGKVLNPATGEYEKIPVKGTGSDKSLLDNAVKDMRGQISQVVGEDGFISPDDYKTARRAWIGKGLDPTEFDTKFKGYRNPNNPYYVTETEAKRTELKEEKPEMTFATSQIDSIAKEYAKSLGVEEAKKLIEQGQINVNGKLTKLTQAQVDEILSSIDSQYPTGQRSFFQKIIPGGK